MNVLAVVPARSGSKGVPGKNIRNLAGKPLMGWMIEAGRRAKLVSRLVCSTDSEEYADIAKRHGAEVPFLRPPGLAGDKTTDIEVLTHAVEWLEKHEGYVPDLVLRLQPTNPTFGTELIDRGIEIMLGDSEADSVRAVTPSPKHPYKMWRLLTASDTLVPFFDRSLTGFDEPYNMGRQQLPPVYVQVGAMEVLRYKTLMIDRSMAGRRVRPLVVDDPLRTVNIDTELDFLLAQAAIDGLLQAGGVRT